MKPCSEKFPDHDFEKIEHCNTWDKAACPSPCDGFECMEFGACIDESTDEDPIAVCKCQMGRVINEDTATCEIPLPVPPTQRPIPTLEPGVKTATTAVTKSASTVLIIFILITLFLFASMRIYDVARVIQMNMEIALVLAHICLLAPAMPENVEVKEASLF